MLCVFSKLGLVRSTSLFSLLCVTGSRFTVDEHGMLNTKNYLPVALNDEVQIGEVRHFVRLAIVQGLQSLQIKREAFHSPDALFMYQLVEKVDSCGFCQSKRKLCFFSCAFGGF